VSGGAQSKAEDAATAERDDRIPDLDLTEDVDVVGGALNTYIATVQGEKQSGARG
jgi:hypothetical protein